MLSTRIKGAYWLKGVVFSIGAWLLMMVAPMPMAGAGLFGLNLGMGIDLLSFCAACMVNAVQRKFDRADGDRLSHASSLAKAVNLDMAAWYTPTAESYFGRIGKQRILDELAEARKSENAPAWAKLKKAELAKLAEREVNGTGWLPEILRS